MFFKARCSFKRYSMDRRDDIAFLKEFRERINQYLFLGYSPSTRMFVDRDGSRKMREALKDPTFQNLQDTIKKMEPRAHTLLKECSIENIWTLKPGGTQKYRLFDLVTNNRTYGNIPKDFFLSKIDMAITDLREIISKGLAFVAVPKFRSDPLEEVRTAIRQVLREHDFAVQRADHLESEETEKILELVEESEILVADLTYSNPDISFEVDHAQKIGKPVICVARKGTEINFDLKGNPVIFFKSSNELVKKLRERLMHLKKKRVI